MLFFSDEIKTMHPIAVSLFRTKKLADGMHQSPKCKNHALAIYR